MNQIAKLFAAFSLKQKITIFAVAAGVIGLLVGLSRWTHERDFKPLYTGLSAEDAGVVVEKVHESGTEYRLSENGSTVLVPSTKVAEVRLQLAAAGIPKTGRVGFELFDKTNFGATDFTEQVNYHRALEGELERSIMGLSEVEQARVHVTFAKDSVFTDNRQPAKASVMVKLRPGSHLSQQNVLAICHLAASAVDQLQPEAVSVLDMQGNLLSRPRHQGSPDMPEPSEAGLEYRQSIEHDLMAKINSTLEPLLGADRFRAGVSVDCNFTSGEQSEETFDPARSVMVSSQKTEDVSSNAGTAGVPGTASNLPRPPARPAGTTTGVSRRTENVAYQTSRVIRKMRLPQGDVKRVSASVLVDYTVRWEGVGPKAKKFLDPPGADKLKTIHDLVAAAIGLTPERGDQLVIETLPFEATQTSAPPEAPQPAPKAAPAGPLPPWVYQYKNIIIGGAVGLVLLVAFLVFGRRRKSAAARATMQAQLAAGAAVANGGEDEATNRMEAQIADQAAAKARLEAEALNALKLAPAKTKKSEVLTKHIAEAAKKDPGAMVHVIRSWLAESER
jgi:flagellar M-ring protein FliF